MFTNGDISHIVSNNYVRDVPFVSNIWHLFLKNISNFFGTLYTKNILSCKFVGFSNKVSNYYNYFYVNLEIKG
jgi:hypothetical protein